MKKSCMIMCAVPLAAFFLPGCATRQTHFGRPLMHPKGEAVPIKQVLDNPAKYAGQIIAVRGRVHEVCAKKGCWLRLSHPDRLATIFVKFDCPIEGRLIPMHAQGHTAIVEGVFMTAEVSVEDARHYAEDAGTSTEEIARITEPRQELQMKSHGAIVLGI